MARTDYVRQLATAYAALRGLDADPAIFDAEITALVAAIAAKVDVGDTAVQTLLGELDVQAGGVTVQAGATGNQAMRASEIVAALALKANLASPTISDPTFTGAVVVPAAAGATSPYQKSEVDTLLALKAALASPAFTGTPTAPTQAIGDNSTKLATTAYVDRARTWKAGVASKTNNAGYDIEVAGSVYNAGVSFSCSVTVGGRTIYTFTTDNIRKNFSFTVPNGVAYTITTTGTATVNELS